MGTYWSPTGGLPPQTQGRFRYLLYKDVNRHMKLYRRIG
jgi:glyoxylate utilization-related uncharacterized protein